MTCEPVRLPGGATAIVCTRGRRRPRCYLCDAPGLYQCDARRGRGTCDRYLCERHRVRTGPDVDYCAEHAGKLVQ